MRRLLKGNKGNLSVIGGTYIRMSQMSQMGGRVEDIFK